MSFSCRLDSGKVMKYLHSCCICIHLDTIGSKVSILLVPKMGFEGLLNNSGEMT